MKKIFHTFALILFANIGYSQFLPTGTSTADNKYRNGSLGIGYTSIPSFGTNKFMVNGTSVFNDGVDINMNNNNSAHLRIKGVNGYANNSQFVMTVAGGDWYAPFPKIREPITTG